MKIEDTHKYVDALAAKAAEAHCPVDALQYSQAASNIAHAAVSLSSPGMAKHPD